MAILSKIRDRSIALIAVIGLALFAFVLDPSQLSDFFSSSKINQIGEVDGDVITRQDFTKRLENYRARNGNRGSEMQAAKFVWDNLVREKIYTKQLEEAGITIGEEDVWNKIISSPGISNNPQFYNEAGMFDEEKFKKFLKEAQENEDQQLWKAWNDYMVEIGNELKRDTYNNLLNAGLGSSLKEGEYAYLEENIKLDASFVYLPFTSIQDTLVTITKKDITKFIKEHEDEYKVEASRSISYVKFDVLAFEEDKENIKKELSNLLEDKKEYNAVSKREEVIKGYRSTEDYVTFFNENQPDNTLVEEYRMKDVLPASIIDKIETGKIGDVFGPYEQANSFRILKITDIVKRPDSVKSSHILIPFVGSAAANASTTKTEDQAKKTADSIFTLVKFNKKKFAEIAGLLNADASKDKGGDIGWTTHTRAMSSGFDRDYANFIFGNKSGEIKIVKSRFGFHIIRIDEQKNIQNAYKTVIFGKNIDPSEKTENQVFQKAEQFALDISKVDGSFFTVARDNKYVVKPAIGLKVLDEKVPGINGLARQIVTWAFQSDTKLSDFKRFDLDKSYVVAFVTDIVEEGLMSPEKAINKVRPYLLNEKKASILNDKMKGASLEDLAKANNLTVKTLSGVSLNSPTITGVGFEPKVVGAMFKAKENEVINKVVGNNGVFAFKVTKKQNPTPLPNYESYRQRISEEQRNRAAKVLESLKKAAEIEDNRAVYYGIN